MALELGNKFSQQLEARVVFGPIMPLVGMAASMAMMGKNKPKMPPPPPPPPPPVSMPDPRSRRAEAESEEVLRRKLQGRGRGGTILTNDSDQAGGGGDRVAGGTAAPAATFQNKTLGV